MQECFGDVEQGAGWYSDGRDMGVEDQCGNF